MTIFCQLTPQVLQKVFHCITRIKIQVRGGGTVFLGVEQGEVTNPSDGIMLTQNSTSPPWDTWWKGDMWYRTDTPGQTFVLLITGKEGSGF